MREGEKCKDVPGNVFTPDCRCGGGFGTPFGVEGMWAVGVQLCGNDKMKAGPKSRQR